MLGGCIWLANFCLDQAGTLKHIKFKCFGAGHWSTLVGFPSGSTVKNPPARQEPQQTGLIPGSARSPEEGNGYPPSILTWRVPWTEEPSGLYSPWGCKESDTTEATWHACRAPSPKAKSFPRYYIPGLSGDRKEGSFGPEGQL